MTANPTKILSIILLSLAFLLLLITMYDKGYSQVIDQPPAPEDSVKNQAPSDSSATLIISEVQDSLTTTQVDTLLKVKQPSSEIDTVITYSADSIYFDVNRHTTILQGYAKVVFKDMALTAGRITVDWDHNMLKAEPIPDTTWRDSIVYQYDTLQVTMFDTITQLHYDSLMIIPSDSTIILVIEEIDTVGYPLYIQGDDEMTGLSMDYNLKTKKGFVVQGETQYLDGYYYGSEIKRMQDKVMNVGKGDFTTCELDTPHYHFHSKKMKLIVKDKVIAKPLVLYFSQVPVAIIPFGIFPSRSGRQSGIIVPVYGETASQGRFLRNLGYYYAPSRYWDVRGSLDFYERYGVLARANGRYKVLYRMDGRVSGSFVRMDYAGSKERRWDIQLQHDHILTPTARLNVNATFVSDGSYYQDLSSNPQDRMERTIRSNATFRDSYSSFNGSMSININHEQNLDDETTSTTLPRISFRLGQRSFIPQGEDQDEPYWYNKIYYSAGSNYVNVNNKNRYQQTITITEPDTSYSVTDYYYKWTKQAALKNSYSISTSQAVLGYFNINPGLSIRQDITDYRLNYYYNPAAGVVESVKEDGFFARHTFSLSAGLNTKLYGMFPADFLSVTGFRHVISPSVSFSYQPDFSRKGWGYYQYLPDSSGTMQKYDRFTGQSLLGGTPAAESKMMSFTLGNLFQMKRIKGKGTKEEEVQKLDLFSLNFSSNYNFSAEQFKLGNLSSSFRAEPIRGTRIGPLTGLTVDLYTTHSPYMISPTGQLIDKFYYEDGNWQEGKILRLTNFNLITGWSFASTKKKKQTSGYQSEYEPAGEDTLGLNTEIFEMPPLESEDRLSRSVDFEPIDIPWNLNTSFRYTWSRPNPNVEPTKTLWIDNSLSLTLSENWSISYSNSIDLATGQVVSSGFTFYRDMHCWEGRFIWNPSGVGQGFFIKINPQSSSLHDLKVEKRKGQGGFLGY